jgi:hypothetical protein
MTASSDTKFISDFKSILGKIVKELVSLPKEATAWNEKPGEWTICQIAHHLEDDGDVWGFLVKRALAIPGVKARFEDFPGNEVWAAKLHFDCRPLEPSIARIQTYRDSLVDVLEACPEGYDNTLRIIGEDGKQAAEMNVRQIVEMLSEHASEHLETIKRIKKSH